jgi:hypothetical protein
MLLPAQVKKFLCRKLLTPAVGETSKNKYWNNQKSHTLFALRKTFATQKLCGTSEISSPFRSGTIFSIQNERRGGQAI